MMQFPLPNQRCISTCVARNCIRFITWCAITLATYADALAAPQRTGEQIYRSQCASCHGAAGEGTKEHKTPLTGDRSILELTRVIDKTMPEGEPEKCVGEDARQVAIYIYNAFYSPTAQVRNKPARIELARLTVRQYQQSIADLLGSFRSAKSTVKSERGLKAEYFADRGFKNENRVIERVDPVVAFDFGEEAPEKEKFDPSQFSIKWQGSLIAPETAEYEFIIHTEHAARLYVNDLRQPLIDAWVKSGTDEEFRGSMKLLAGRTYPLRLDYSKAKQGVDDSKKNPKKKVAKSSISLKWKLPQRAIEVVPQRCLSPQSATEWFVVQTNFPPDDRSVGYERGTSISKAWDQSTTEAAIEVATYVVSKLESLTGAKDTSKDREQRYRTFCNQFAERAFRRPLTNEQKKLYIDRQFDGAKDLNIAVKQSVLLSLKSPRFLFREVDGAGNNPYDVAARLSFGLWDSLPDQDLSKAAAAGELSSPEKVIKQAERMLSDLRARAKIREFLLQWLKVDQIPDLTKDQQKYPDFDALLATDLRASLEIFLDEVVWSDHSDFRQLLLAESLPFNKRLADFYGLESREESPFTNTAFSNVKLDADRRAGVLTHPYLLSSFAYTEASSPIHRGVMISRSLLGRVLRPPPEAVSPLAAELHASLTTRERVALQTKAEACHVCHGMINPLGFTLENFDAVGKFRDKERGKPINSSGEYLTRNGELVKFMNVRDLAKYLTESDETHSAFVSQLFHHMVKQPIRAYGPEELPKLQKSFEQNSFHIRKLIAEMVASAALHPAYETTALSKRP